MPDRAGAESKPRVERRLAAILTADVVGYSRLMGLDERGTLERLQRHRRELVEPKLAEHRGRMVKLMSDGALAEFASVVDAVQCAAEAGRVAESALRINPDYSIEHRRQILPYKNPADFERVVEGLRRAGIAV